MSLQCQRARQPAGAARCAHHPLALAPTARSPGRQVLALAITCALAGLAAGCLLTSRAAQAAQAAEAGTDAIDRDYVIPVGKLSDALAEFAATSGVQLVFDPQTLESLRSGGLQGRYTIASGFARLLAGSGYEAVASGSGRYLLRPAVSQQEGAADTRGAVTTLATVTVTAPADRAGGLPAPYAGGQVARGGRLGLLGNVDVMDAPFNITNYTSQLIEDQQASTLQDVLKNEPSVRQSSASGGEYAFFKIRGFDVNTSATTFDGLQGMAPVWGSLALEFAERVEVLKGPSALLYGMSLNGVVGGAVNLVPKRAGDKPVTRLTFGVESDALWKGHVDMGRRFGANGEWGLRFNGRYSHGDGYLDGQKKEGHLGAIALDYRGERLRLTLDAYRLQDRTRGASPLNAIVGDFSGSDASWLSSVPAAPDGRTNMLPGSPGNKSTVEAVILGGEYDFNARWTGYARLGAQRNEMMGVWHQSVPEIQANGDARVAPYLMPSEHKTFSAETGLRGRFKTGAVSHALAFSASHLNRNSSSAGVSGVWQSSNIYAPAPIVVWPVPPAHVPKASESTLSGFALADTLGFMDDHVLLTLGVRRQNVESTNFDATTGAVTSGYDASAWSPMAGLVVKSTDDLSLYANVIQGLSQGTTVDSTYQNAGEIFPPYKTKQVEVGAKLQTGRFTNTLSVFQIAQPSTTTDNSTTPLPTLRLDGEQRNRGVEWATFGEVTRGLRMLGGATYLRGRLSKTQDGLMNGNQAPGSPSWAANLGADGDVPRLPGLALSGWVIYTSRQYVDNANSLKMPSWTRLDLGARYATRLAGRDVTFRANVDNVFDKRYWQGTQYPGSVNLGAPRIFRLSVSIDL